MASKRTGAGQLTEQLEIRALTLTPDAQGGDASTWTVLDTVWASIEALSASEQLAIGGISAIGHYKARIYYRADVTVAMRCSWTPYLGTAQTLEIHGVQPDPNDPRRMSVLTLGVVETAPAPVDSGWVQEGWIS